MYKGSILEKEKEIEKEVYRLIENYKKRNPSDKMLDTSLKKRTNNDIDAMRHAYASGVFTMEYNAFIAELLGEMREMFPRNRMKKPSLKGSPEKNMDLWNNRKGRECGQKSKNRNELFDCLIKALKNGELVVSPDDPRKYSLKKEKKIMESVIVARESKSGENLLFLDTKKMVVLSKEEFVTKIKNKEYGDEYEVRVVGGKEVPTSKRDGKDNLG